MTSGEHHGQTHIAPSGERELVTTRLFNAPPRIVFKAWSEAGLFQRWWVPQSSGLVLLSCVMDVRVGGSYRLEFKNPQGGAPLAFFGRYTVVEPPSTLAWTNEEGPDAPLTTVTFEARGDQTWLTMRELYPSAAARDQAYEGMGPATGETFDQLEAFLMGPAG